MPRHKTTYLILWFLCLVGSLAAIPYIHYLGVIPLGVSFTHLLLASIFQSIILFGLACYLSYLLVPKTDLIPFRFNKRLFFIGIIAGVFSGLLVYLLDFTFFKSSLLSGKHPPFWAGLLASLYGGINEEVLLRLFLFTLIYFLFKKLPNRTWALWITNFIVALIFGLGHLPTALKLTAPTPIEITRVLVLNGIPGLVFGWLYFSRSLWTAMLAHFIADLMIHVFFIS